jgi:hypothetical protein
MTSQVSGPGRRGATGPGAVLRRLLSEPMLHFLLIGILVFAVHSRLAPPAEPPANLIVVTEDQVARLTAQFEAVWNRAPDAPETARLIDDHVEEEIYLREALLLGLDQGDPVIRQRLRVKMEFLLSSGTETLVPDAAALQAQYDAIKDRLAVPARLSFAQILLGEADAATAGQALEALAAGADPATVGRATLLPPVTTDATPAQIDGVFGPAFFDAIASGPPGVWTGPYASAFGQHLVYVMQVTPGETPPLDSVRDRVIEDWRREQGARQQAETYAYLRSRYEVVLPDPAADPAGDVAGDTPAP